jgi:hypothetical protein
MESSLCRKCNKKKCKERMIKMNLLIAAIAIFGLGWVANELTTIPTLFIVASCFALIIGIIVMSNRKKGK